MCVSHLIHEQELSEAEKARLDAQGFDSEDIQRREIRAERGLERSSTVFLVSVHA